MIRHSVVVRLWIAMVALFALTVAILLSSVSTVVTNFYVRMRVDELDRHADEIVRLVQSGKLGADANATVNLVAATSGAMVMIVGQNGEVLSGSEGMTAITDMGHVTAMKDVRAALAGQNSWSIVKDPETRATLLSLALPLQMVGSRAALVFLAPAGPIQQTVGTVERVLLVLAVSGIVVITVLAFFLSRRLSRPLIYMSETASAMAGGDFSRRVDASSDDEVGRLGRSMNHMSEQLQQTMTALAAERDQLTTVLARERQLAEAQKDFVANVSHELRTPLTYLQGYTEAILDGLVGPDEQRRYLQIVLEESQRLRRLVADLLDLTVIESGQAPMRPERLPIGGLISDVTVSLRPIAESKPVRIIDPDPATAGQLVVADADRTKQVLVNLLDNAIRYSPPQGQVRVTVSALDAHGMVWVAVSDSGPGIAPAALPHVWDRFFKADRARRRDTSGTGLGLAIARSIVEAQGGHVRVESTVGKGTTFSFSLPSLFPHKRDVYSDQRYPPGVCNHT